LTDHFKANAYPAIMGKHHFTHPCYSSGFPSFLYCIGVIPVFLRKNLTKNDVLGKFILSDIWDTDRGRLTEKHLRDLRSL